MDHGKYLSLGQGFCRMGKPTVTPDVILTRLRRSGARDPTRRYGGRRRSCTQR